MKKMYRNMVERVMAMHFKSE